MSLRGLTTDFSDYPGGKEGFDLDEARMRQALFQMQDMYTPGVNIEQIARLAARLAREGWTPPDPLGAEVAHIFKCYPCNGYGRDHPTTAIRRALERGIEIGRMQRDQAVDHPQ